MSYYLMSYAASAAQVPEWLSDHCDVMTASTSGDSVHKRSVAGLSPR